MQKITKILKFKTNFFFQIKKNINIFFNYLNIESVLLIAATVRIRHEVEHVVVITGGRRHKVEADGRVLGQGEAFDGDECVLLRLTNHHPPAFVLFLQIEGRDGGNGLTNKNTFGFFTRF